MSQKLAAACLALTVLACGGPDEQTAQEVETSRAAMHSWGGYHWARTSNPFNLKLGDNVTAAWDSYLRTASTDWSKSTVLDTTVVAGTVRNAKRCNATSGRVEVCNASYGRNGWLGIAQIWLSGGHISQGIVKVNDTYYSTATYNTPAWRLSVMCQEIGHTLGLAHNDEDFSTVNGTCMDYANDPTQNQHPDQHDYDQLASIYAHLDSTTTVGAIAPMVAGLSLDDRAAWGQEVASGRSHSTFVRDFGGGLQVVTEVRWIGDHDEH